MPHGREWTVDDLAGTPDDGLRYELVDGVLLVSNTPSNVHQIVQAELFALLRAVCPADHRVLAAPCAYEPTRRRSLQPDVLVVARDRVPRLTAITEPLLLAVEVLSPSTRSVDLVLKRAVYEESGVTAYWVVDPLVPSVTAWSLRDGAYVEVGAATGDEALGLHEPFAVTLVPQDLLDT